MKRKSAWNITLPWGRRIQTPSQTRLKVLRYFNYECVYCGEFAGEVDHVIPYSFGGDNDFDNLVSSCKRCNGLASNKIFDHLGAKINYIRAKIGMTSDYIHPLFVGIEWEKLGNMERPVNWVTCSNCHSSFQSGRPDRGRGTLCYLCLDIPKGN